MGGSCEPQPNDRKFLPLGEGGEAETLFRLDGWGTSQISSPKGKTSGHFFALTDGDTPYKGVGVSKANGAGKPPKAAHSVRRRSTVVFI